MADVVRTITLRFKTEGEAQTTAATQRLATSLENVATVSDRNARAALSAERGWERLQRSTDQAYAATKRFGEAQVTTQKALEQGLTNQQRANEVLNFSRQRMEAAAKASHQFGNETKLTRYELINLSRQLQDVGVGLASGQRLFTILIQQGTQIGDVFASSNVTFGGFVKQLGSIITPARLAAAGIIGLTAAVIASAVAWKNWALAVDDAARSAGLSNDQFLRLQRSAETFGISFEDTAKTTAALGQAVVQLNKGMGPLADWFYFNGIRAKTTAEALEGVRSIISRLPLDVEKLAALQSMGFNNATMETVRLLSQTKTQFEKMLESQRGSVANQERFTEALREADRAQRQLWVSMKALGIQAITPLIEVWVKLLDLITKIVVTTSALWDKWKEGTLDLTRMGKEFSETWEKVSKAMIDVPVPGPKPIDPDAAKRALAIEIQRLSMIREIATVDEVRALKQKEIQQAIENSNGMLKLTEEQKQKLVSLDEHQFEINRAMLRGQLELLTIQGALGLAENQTRIEQIRGNITFEERERVLGRMRLQALQMVPVFKTLQDAALQFTQSLVQGLLQGQSLARALENALTSLASSMASAAIQMLPMAIATGNFTAVGITAAIAAGSAIFGNMLREDREERERQQRIADNRAQNLGLHQTLLGVIPGSVSENIRNVFDQVIQAGREAAELGDTEEVIRLGNEFQAFLQRTLEEFRRGLPNLIRYLEETSQLNNAFSQAAQQMRQLGDALMGIGADISAAGLGGGTEIEAQFLAAARGAVLAMVRGADEMSDLQTALQSAQGAAHEAVRVLQQLGMSAEDAAAAVEEQLIIALDRLRTEAIDQLTRRINELLGRGYINDFLDLFQDVTTLMQDFASLSLDPAMINQFFALAAQDIVNQAQLTGQAFQDLLAVFPQLVGVVTEFVEVADALDETTARVTEAQENLRRAYEEESRALQQTIDRMRNFAEQLRNLRRSLLIDPSVSVLSPQQRFEETQRQFRETAAKALTGDVQALEDLQDISKKYLDEAAAYYASSEQYFQAFSEVQSVLEQAEQYASAQVDIAQQQLDALTQQVSLLVDINDNVMSVAEAIEALMGARNWGLNPNRNQQIVAALQAAGINYTGNFGGGAFNQWVLAQTQAMQALIAQIVTPLLSIQGHMGGLMPRLFGGGLVTNGMWNVDSVMARFQGGGTAMLAGGEFVTRAPSVTPATLPMLAEINATGRTPAANDNRENFKELARVWMRENRALRQEVAELRAELRSSMKMVADATRQTSNEQRRRATR